MLDKIPERKKTVEVEATLNGLHNIKVGDTINIITTEKERFPITITKVEKHFDGMTTVFKGEWVKAEE